MSFFLDDFREQSKLISILISSLIQQSPLLCIYKEKKKLLLDTLTSQKLNEKNLFKVINHRIEKLTTLLDATETQPNEIRIKCENSINEANDKNACSSTIRVETLLKPQS